jgi:capsule biosynthesis phosphatase
MSTYVVDIDGTLCGPPLNKDYSTCEPIKDVIDQVNRLYESGHKIILFTARGMRSYNKDIEDIHTYVKPILIKWLNNHNVKYHELIFGKPWGEDVWYIDDRSISISDFIKG